MPKDADDSMQYLKEEVLQVLKQLNTLVVSLDRIGSASRDGEDCDELLVDVFNDWQVFHRLAECRAIPSRPFSTRLARDDTDELERELQGVPHWKFDARKPPE